MTDFGDLVSLVKTFGPAIVVVVFVFWRDFRREDRLTARIEALEKANNEILLPLVEKCSAVIAQNTHVIGKIERLLEN